MSFRVVHQQTSCLRNVYIFIDNMSDSDSDSVSKRTGKRKRSKEEEQEHDRTKLARIKDQWETKEAKAQLQFVIDQSNLEIAPFQCASVMLGLCHFCGAHLM